jgi:hypothetical protein
VSAALKKRFVLFLILVVFVWLQSSCSFLSDHDYIFVNNSSFTLTISPNGQTGWLQFLLSSGNSRAVTIPAESIAFIYDHATLIDCDTTSTTDTIIFTDKPGYSVAAGNYANFGVTDGTHTVDYSWNASSSNIGFLSGGSYLFSIFKATDGYQDTSGYFHNYLFVQVKDRLVGSYDNSDGATSISFYDTSGNLYMIFTNRPETFARVSITKWQTNDIEGTIEAMLMTYPAYTYIGIVGSFRSFDSSGSRAIGISSMSNDEYANRSQLKQLEGKVF